MRGMNYELAGTLFRNAEDLLKLAMEEAKNDSVWRAVYPIDRRHVLVIELQQMRSILEKQKPNTD